MTIHTTAAVADLARAHAATGGTDALAKLLAAALTLPDLDPAGDAARDYLEDEVGALHFMLDGAGGWVAYGVDRQRPR